MTARRIGAFVCHCGGNISDYLDVNEVCRAAEGEPGVVAAKTFPFACSDAAQEEMARIIREEHLDGIVIASCSPRLHLQTFRAMADRAGLNRYMYTQVNIREQCSWAHRHAADAATGKAVGLVRAGIARTRLGEPLEDLRIETVPRVLVIGAGVAGMRAALALSDMGLTVYLAEREPAAGGQIAGWGRLFPDGRDGAEIAGELLRKIRARENIVLYTGAVIAGKSGSVGNFSIRLRAAGGEEVVLRVGAVVVATGFDRYAPRPSEFGYGLDGVVTLPEFRDLLAGAGKPLRRDGRDIRTIVYIYCVGSRRPASPERHDANPSCSRYCCTAAVHTAILANEADAGTNQYHLIRDMRTYGRYEALFEEAGRRGSVFVRYGEDSPPRVERAGDGLLVRVRDELLGGEEIGIPADLVVLVTGMVPRKNAALIGALKLPIGRDGFLNEIHPKLRPVETVIDGVFIAGAAQGPRTVAECAASSLAAAAKAGALLLKGHVDLSPFVARIDPQRCVWCGECAKACPYDGAVAKVQENGKEIASVHPALCKGCGGCVPACPDGAVVLEGCTDAQVTAMIDALAGKTA